MCAEENAIDATVHNVSLADASREKYFLKQVEMSVIVSGKDLAPYFVPKKIKFSCCMGSKKCSGCGLGPNGSQGEFKMEISHPADILNLIDVNDAMQKSFLKKKAKIQECHNVNILVEEAQNIEEVRLIPEIEFSSKDTEYVTRQVFVLGGGVKTNASYIMRGVTVPDPKTQYATQVIQNIEPMQLSIDHFRMTPDLRDSLRCLLYTSPSPRD